jgi:hypothetical protein
MGFTAVSVSHRAELGESLEVLEVVLTDSDTVDCVVPVTCELT